MPNLKPEITSGNVASIVTTIIAIGALVYHFSGEQAERRAKDDEFERTITRLIVERDARRKVVDERFEFIMRDRTSVGERTARLEEQNRLILDAVKRVETKLDRSEGQRN